MDRCAVNVSDLSVQFSDGTSALRSINLTVDPGQFVAVVGPSGCGKSTLLRAVSGLQTPTTGTIDRKSAHLAFVFQDPTLLPWLTTVANVALPLRIAGEGHTSAHEKASLVLEEVGLGNDLHKLPRQLSGGMRMRASVARALVTEPEVFLFDEPFAAVDEIKRQSLNDMLMRVHVQREFSALFVTHSVTEAVYLADRVIVLTGSPGEIAADLAVTFPRPRVGDLRFDPRFTEICRTITTILRDTDVLQ